MSKLTDEQLVDELFKLKESWKHEPEDKFLKLYPRPMKHILDAMFREHLEKKQELKRWKAVALYLADCHAANAESPPKSLSKYNRQRYASILMEVIKMLKGIWPSHTNLMRKEVDVLERCEQAYREIEV